MYIFGVVIYKYIYVLVVVFIKDINILFFSKDENSFYRFFGR